MKEQREKWKECLPHFDSDQLVFIDESGVNIDMTRLYGRSDKRFRTTHRNAPALSERCALMDSYVKEVLKVRLPKKDF